MSVTVTTNGVTAQISVQALGTCFTFERQSGGQNDAVAVADVVSRSINEMVAKYDREKWEERDRRIEAERAVTALRGQVTKLKNKLARRP